MKIAVAYLRKSRVFKDKAVVSPETQENETRTIAARDGHDDLLVLSDMNKSGKKSRAKRPGYHRLLTMIEAGEVSTIYSYSLSRLSRSMRDLGDLVELCVEHNVTIRLVRDPDPDPTTAMGRMIINILGVMAQFEADLASERAIDTVVTRRARGDKLGPRFYGDGQGEDDQLVVDAFRVAGSYQGAARLLNLKGVPARGGGLWRATSLRGVLQRVAPELLPARSVRGARSVGGFRFSQLLRCYCGRTLTGALSRGLVRYTCAQAYAEPTHVGPKSVQESHLLAWIQAEAAMLRPVDGVSLADVAAQREALLGRKRRLSRAFVDQGIEEGEYEAGMASVDEELSALDAAGSPIYHEPIDWAGPPSVVNGILRSMFHHVELGPDLRPVAASWTMPAWRAPGSNAVQLGQES